MSCSDVLAVHSCPLLCEQRWVAKVASGLSYCWSLLRNNKWQQICKGSLYITVAGVLLHETVERRHLGRYCSEKWHNDSGRPRTFICCEKKHEWIYSNASISLQNLLLVGVWPMCLSVKLPLSRLLFMQYKITWLVTVKYIYAGLWEYVFIVKV